MFGSGAGPRVGQRMQHPVAALGHHRPAGQVDAADAFGRPVGIAAEQRVVVRRAQEAHDAQLLHELVPELLGAGLVQRAFAQIALDVDVEEGRDAADRHRRAVRLLDGAEIGEIGPLDRLLGIRGRARDVAVVELGHRREVFQRPHLVGDFLALTDHFVGRPHVVELRPLGLLGLEQPRDAVEGDAAIVADDAAAAIGVGQAGDDARLAAAHDLRRVGVEHAVVVRLAIMGERVVDLRIGFETRGLQARLDHAQAAVREDRTLERLIGLQADDDFVVLVDIAGLVREQRGRRLGVDGQNAFLLLLLEIGLQLAPTRPWCARWRARETIHRPCMSSCSGR